MPKISELTASATLDGTEVTPIVQDGITKKAPFGKLTKVALPVSCSDLTTAITAGTGKMSFHIPLDFALVSVMAELFVPQTSGSIFTVDINAAGSSILSTKLTIDNTEETSATAATPAVISDAALTGLEKISIDVDQVGDGTAKGLIVWLIGYWA